jgi:Zn-dependent protease
VSIDPAFIPIWFVIFLLSLSIHEAAHAWTAEMFGDSTGRYLGRVTLNPIPHIDIVGTIIFPLVAVLGPLLSGGGSFPMFGWAKPVPFNPNKLRDRRWGEIGIALAGPFSNLLLAIIFFVLLKVVFFSSLISPETFGEYAAPAKKMLVTGLTLNIVLAVFNLLPIPPLDGSHVLRNLLPDGPAELYARLYDFGFLILFGLMMTGIIGVITYPILNPIFGLVETLLSL